MPESDEKAQADYDRARAEMDRLTSAPGGPGQSWRWSIPANPERDSDLIFADALAHIPALLSRLAAVEALMAEWDADLDSGRIRDLNARYCWNAALNELRRAMSNPPASTDGGERA